METISIKPPKESDGYKIKRVREIVGMKQTDLANEMGVNQSYISQIESKPVVDEATMGKIAKILGVTVEEIRNYSDDTAINVYLNINDNAVLNNPTAIGYNHDCTFNPIEKIVELSEKLLQAEKEKNTMLQAILKKYGVNLDEMLDKEE